MKRNAETLLEFDQIKAMLCENALSDRAKERLNALEPFLSEAECARHLAETTSARRILDALGTPPVASMKGINEVLALTQAGALLQPDQLTATAQFCASCQRMQSYLKRAEAADPLVSSFGGSFSDQALLREEIELCIRAGEVDSAASPALRDIRRRIENVQNQIKAKLASLLQSQKSLFSDGGYVLRDGHYTLPVKQEYRRRIEGSVIGMSGSGGTCFIEPASIAKLQNDAELLRIEEDGEVRRILYSLTNDVADAAPSLRTDIEAMETLDFLFAKARLSAQMQAAPILSKRGKLLRLRQGMHPLLDRKACVPLDFELGGKAGGERLRGAVITGPNTGGKTVALKTVGLLSMMAQCGLHVPASPDSELCMFSRYLCDVGDGQSISENLSTFSAHMKNVITILEETDCDSLVLLDELGSGTDPAEGMGIAVAVLEELRERGCLFLATTHYPEVKEYAERTAGIVNARMAFDRETLRPLYQLELGQSGESCALFIAQRLGLSERLLRRARREAYGRAASERAGEPPKPAVAAEPEPEASPSRPRSRLKRDRPQGPVSAHAASFQVGDSVLVYPEKKTGLVFHTANGRGELGVQIRKEKRWINHKRLKLQVPAGELYPEDYDFSVVFDSVANRKAVHQMNKGHRPGVEARYDPSGL